MNNQSTSQPFQVTGTFRLVAFYDLLADAVFQNRQSGMATDDYTVNRFARASILASALCVECVANCLLESLELSKPLREELDKLSPIPKIEVYFRFKNIKDFNRGRVEVCRIAELMRARNEHVHPKTKSFPVTMSEPEDGGDNWILPMSLDYEQWNNLKIPKRSMMWSSECSLTALKAIAEFFKYIFSSLHTLTKEELQNIFMPQIEIGKFSMTTLSDAVRLELENIDSEGVDFSYFGMYPGPFKPQ